MSEKPTQYYVPEQSPWPFITGVILGVTAYGAASFVQQNSGSSITSNAGTSGTILLPLGILGLMAMMFFWFKDTIKESLTNMNSGQLDISYRMGML